MDNNDKDIYECPVNGLEDNKVYFGVLDIVDSYIWECQKVM